MQITQLLVPRSFINQLRGLAVCMVLDENAKKSLINHEKAEAVIFDVSHRFGNRNRLLYKIKRLQNIRKVVLNFLHIQSFLSNRQQDKINYSFGEWIQSNVGTSVGIQLGPLLFITLFQNVSVRNLRITWYNTIQYNTIQYSFIENNWQNAIGRERNNVKIMDRS